MFSFVQWKPEAAGLKTESENRKEQMKTHSALLGGGDLLCDSARNAFQTLQKHDAAVCCSFRALAAGPSCLLCRSGSSSLTSPAEIPPVFWGDTLLRGLCPGIQRQTGNWPKDHQIFSSAWPHLHHLPVVDQPVLCRPPRTSCASCFK